MSYLSTVRFNRSYFMSKKPFSFTEYLEGGEIFEACSYGGGRFRKGMPRKDSKVYFRVCKVRDSLTIDIHNDSLLQWLHSIPLLRDGLDMGEVHASISMRHLLPCYPDVRKRFAQDKDMGHSFDALDLFVCHFLREGSVFATFGLKHLLEEQILTELHFHDIQGQGRSISEHLNLLDVAIDEIDDQVTVTGDQAIDKQSIKGPNYSSTQEPLRSQLRAAIQQRNPKAVGIVLAMVPDLIDVRTLCFAIPRFEPTVFGLLLEHGAEVDGCAVSNQPLYLAAKAGHMEAVQLLLSYGANKEGCSSISPTPLTAAASGGHLEIVQYLVEEGNAMVDGNYFRSPLSCAIQHRHTHIVDYLFRAGADVRKCSCLYQSDAAEFFRECGLQLPQLVLKELLGSAARSGDLDDLDDVPSLVRTGANTTAHAPQLFARDHDNLCANIPLYDRYHLQLEPAVADVGDCTAAAAVQAQERRTMARRLLAKVESSREKLLEAGFKNVASARLTAFVGQIGTSSSVWRSGTRAIRDISEGFKPSSLSSIVSALQVANAMRSVVPPSKRVCSKREFINDIPRWASLLSLDDRILFFEIASCLWGIPTSRTVPEVGGTFSHEETLIFFQELVDNVVRTSGMFEPGPEGRSRTYRLHTLRQQQHSALRCAHTCQRRPPLTEWSPLPAPEVQESLHTDAPRPRDPEEERLSVLSRITVLMAGAIFGAILLYLCWSRYGVSHLRPPAMASHTGPGMALDDVLTRNCVTLATYIGSTSTVDSGSWKSTDDALPVPTPLSLGLSDDIRMERLQEHMVASQSICEDGWTGVDPSSASTIDAVMEDAPANCEPSPPSHLTSSPSATTLSPSTITTATPCSTSTGTSEDGAIRCEISSCESIFKLGKNGRRGQASNMQKHMRTHHSNNIVIYECVWGCGRKDRYKSNIEVHEKKHCKRMAGKQARRHGGRRDARAETS